MLICCDCRYWKPIGKVEDATNGYCRMRAPAAIMPYRISAKELSERDKFELGERDIPPRSMQPLHPISNALWGCGEALPLTEE